MKTIKNYKLFKESLLDHLKGPTEEEIVNLLRKNYTEGRISLERYIKLCKEYNVKGPSEEEIAKYWKRYFKLNNPEDMYKLALRLGYFNGVLEAIKKDEELKNFGNQNAINYYYTKLDDLYLFNDEERNYIINILMVKMKPEDLLDNGIKQNNYHVVKHILEYDNGYLFNNYYKSGPRTYFLKVSDSDVNMIRLMLEYVDEKFKKSIEIPVSVISKAVYNNDVELLNFFIECGISLHGNKIGDSYDEDVLILAIEENKYDIVKLLIENGSDVNADNGKPLQIACEEGYLDIVKLLVENGANVNGGYTSIGKSKTRDEYPVGISIYDNNYEQAKYLIEKGAEPNNACYNFISGAMKNGTPEIKELLDNIIKKK